MTFKINRWTNSLFLIICICILSACNGGGGGSSSGGGGTTNLGTLSNGSTVQSSSGSFALSNGQSTTGTIGLTTGTGPIAGIMSMSVSGVNSLSTTKAQDTNLPTVTMSPNPCIINTSNPSQMSCTFTISTSSSVSNGNYTITPTFTPTSGPAQVLSGITVTSNGGSAPTAGNLSVIVNNTSLTTGGTTTATVSLSGSIGVFSLPVTVGSSSGALGVTPSSCNLSTTTNSCQITVNAAAAGSATVNASASGYTTASSSTVTVNSPVVAGNLSVALTSPNLGYGGNTTATVTLNGSSGISTFPVTVAAADTSIATVSPSSCQVSTVSPTCTVTVTAGSQTNTTAITASADNYTQAQTTVNVSPNPVAGTLSIALGSSNITVGESTTATVTLSGSIGIAAFPVTIASGNTGIATVNPSTCLLSSESNTCSVSIIAGSLTESTPITASATGYSSTQTTISISPVPVAGTLALTLGSNTLAYGESTLATVSLIGSSGVSGLTVNITSANTSVATVNPISCTVSSVKNNCSVTITAGSQTESTTIIASSSGYSNAQATFNVTAPSSFMLVGQFGEINTLSATNQLVNIASPVIFNGTVSGVASNGNVFVAVGPYGVILTSPDGINWTAQSSGIFSYAGFNAVTYGDGKFVAVGSQVSQNPLVGGNEAVIETSPDGITWTNQPIIGQYSDIFPILSSITYGGGQFIAVGGTFQSVGSIFSGTILTSPDGINWTTQSDPDTAQNHLNSVTYSGSKYVAVGYYGTILTSPDGVVWESQIDPAPFQILNGVTYGDGKFVAVGDGGGSNGIILTSPDGESWALQTNPASLNYLFDVTYGGGQFIVVGQQAILTSPDGIIWTDQTFPNILNSYLQNIIYSGNKFVAVGGQVPVAGTVANSYNGAAFTSTNGINWTSQSTQSLSMSIGNVLAFTGISSGGGKFVAVGFQNNHNESGSIYTSNDGGITWGSHKDPDPSQQPLQSVAYGGGQFVAVGGIASGTILTSSDGESWAYQTCIGSGAGFNSVTYGDGEFVAVGGEPEWSGVTCTSTDGVAWDLQNNNQANSVTYGGGKFVAVGANATSTSPDGIVWTTKLDPYGPSYNSVTYGDGKFVAVGPYGVISTSPDGVIWTTQSSSTNAWLNGVTYAGGEFVAVGGFTLNGLLTTTNIAGTILTSPDGINWTQMLPVMNNLSYYAIVAY